MGRPILPAAPSDWATDVRSPAEAISENNQKLVSGKARHYRPWGYYESLDLGPCHQVKRLVVNPGGRLSLQKHLHRSEHWTVVGGTAEVTLDNEFWVLEANQTTYIPVGAVHRVGNPGKRTLTIIEVQYGSYLGEDDIVRLDDVYGRV